MEQFTIYLSWLGDDGPIDIWSTTIEAKSLDLAQMRAFEMFDQMGPGVGAQLVRLQNSSGTIAWECG